MGRARAWGILVCASVVAGALLFAGLTAALSRDATRADVGSCMMSSHDVVGLPPDREQTRALQDGERITFQNPAGKWHRVWSIEGARLVRLQGDGTPGPQAWEGTGGGGGCGTRASSEAYLVEGSGTLTVREWVLR